MIAFGRYEAFKANYYFFVGCPAGFYGFGCNTTCPFPTFGQRCLGHCNCLEDRCDYINGCKIGNIFFNKYNFSFEYIF